LLPLLQKLAGFFLIPLRNALGRGFEPAALNPFRHLGALTIFFFWIVLVSGIWLFIFFRTSVDGAYESLEYLTHEQWYLGGVMRSLHRYASDAAIITIALHIFKEFAFDRYRGARWFSWFTGVPLLWLVFPLGITGYWLVWDELAHYVALTSAELLDAVPIFTDSMARNFLSDEALSDRFFTLMAFLHLLGLPLFLVIGIWLHVFRINGPQINPPRLLMSGSLLAMLLLSLVFPALSQEKADLARVTSSLAMDWYYLLVYPLVQAWSPGWTWALLVGISLLIGLAPWLPPQRPARPATVNLDNCNGCERCAEDCPFGAITMQPRSDGKAYSSEAVVDPALCLSCGICVGACPTAMPFRKRSDLVPGIDLPDHSMAQLRESINAVALKLDGDRRVLVFGCEGSTRLAGLADHQTGVIGLVCLAQLPPSFLDYVLSRDFADGVFLTGCAFGDCQYRFGARWTRERVSRDRDPRLRKRVDTSRIAMGWLNPWKDMGDLPRMLAEFRSTLGARVRAFDERRGKPRRLAVRAVAWGLFAALIGALSVWPRYQLLEPGHAIVSLTFSHAGQRIHECRRLTQEALNELPPNMRKPLDCPRERLPVFVEFSVDGATVYRENLQPSGIWKDGESTVYRRIEVKSGMRELFIGMRDSNREAGFDFQHEEQVLLGEGQHLVAEFDHIAQTFLFR
jgi:quinol-cytochrome oxidoreductase complex cytochrome b subunit/coenzyme F420-reducing hydrogenase delta subunit